MVQKTFSFVIGGRPRFRSEDAADHIVLMYIGSTGIAESERPLQTAVNRFIA
jgi:hypothetical protein